MEQRESKTETYKLIQSSKRHIIGVDILKGQTLGMQLNIFDGEIRMSREAEWNVGFVSDNDMSWLDWEKKGELCLEECKKIHELIK